MPCARSNAVVRCTRAERTLLANPWTLLPAKTTGDVYLDDFVILSDFQLSDVQVDSSPIKVRRADALYDFLQMPTNAGKSGSTLTGEFWGGHLDGVAGTHSIPLERRVSLMLVAMLVAGTWADRTFLQRLLGGWAFTLAFR